ncbi:MAG TPA: hypothetical protein DCP69_11030 [Candidatus Omnitrophica bacterium]|nr:hypothetical protein [Candidatus Omnitrophota bacterium]
MPEIKTMGPKFVRQAVAALLRAFGGEALWDEIMRALSRLLEPYPIHVTDRQYAFAQLKACRRIEEEEREGREWWKATERLEDIERCEELESKAMDAIKWVRDQDEAYKKLMGHK